MVPMRSTVPLLATVLGIAVPASALDEARFRELHEQLTPSQQEAWRDLPWELSIRNAQARATAERKPVYMLVRSGHPLGCV